MAHKQATADDIDRLLEIKEEMRDLLDEAMSIVHGTDEEDSARGYWFAQIRIALDKDHDFIGGSMCTMQETIDALEDGCNCEECGEELAPHEIREGLGMCEDCAEKEVRP